MIHGASRLSAKEHSLEVRYTEEPDGGEPAVVCLPGLACDDAYYMPTLRHLRGRGVRGLSLSFPGEGPSPMPVSGSLTAHDLIEVTSQFLNERSIERAVLVAHSRSGPVAVHPALAYPDRVARLVLIEPRLTVEDCDWARQMADIGPEGTLEFRDQKAEELLRSGDPGRVRYHNTFARTLPEVLHTYSSTLVECVAHDDLVEKLKSLAVPRTLVFGKDNKASIPYLGELADSGVDLVELPGGHFPMFEDPVGFAHEIGKIVTGIR